MDYQTDQSANAEAAQQKREQLPSSQGSKALILAEYGMLGTSAVGTVAAFVTKQVAYAAAPLSVSLFLNLLQRQQLNRRLETQAQQSSQQAQVLKAKLQEDLGAVHGDLETVTERLTQQEKLERDRPDFASQIETLQQRTTEQIQTTADELKTSTTEQLKGLQAALQGVASQDLLTQLQAEFTAQQQQSQTLTDELKASQVKLSNELKAEQAQLQRYIQEHQQTHQTLDSQTQTAAETLQKRLLWLEDQLEQLRQPEPVAPPEATPAPLAEIVPSPPAEPPAATTEVATLFLNLGIDFGTRFTKVCFQNLSDGQSEVIPFQSNAPILSNALLLSQVGILPNGQLIAGLSESEWEQQLKQQPEITCLDGLKMHLASLGEASPKLTWQSAHWPQITEPEQVENLCAYYLSRVIQRSQLWIREYRPRLVANETIGWTANVGVPVAYCDEQPVSDRFQRVLSLAWLLSNQPQTEVLTLELLTDQMTQLRQQLNQASNCHAVPEIAAESWSFLNSRQAQEGYYLFFDIGDGTIDGCVFNYERAEDEHCIEFYHAQVQPLGVSALSQALSKELEISTQQATTQLKRKLLNTKLTQSAKCKEVLQMMAQVVVKGGKAYGAHHPSEKDSTYQEKLTVFLGGGGSQLQFFKQWPAQTYQAFGHHNLGIQGYEVKALPAPKQLQLNGLKKKDFHRFAVAFGLSTDHANLDPAIHLPQEMASHQPKIYASQSVGGDVTPYEDSKDAY